MQQVVEGWRLVRQKEERYWIRERAGVVFLFGIGPARGSDKSADRLRAFVRAADLALNAVRFGEQVHGRVIAALGQEPGRPFSEVASVGRCDGLITDENGLGLAVWTADCVPVLMAGGGVVAAIHAGWRGAAAGIVHRAVRRFEVEYGVPPQQIEAILGPAVGPCHYEVGGEVLSALAGGGPAHSIWRLGNRVDLRAYLGAQLSNLGFDETAIHRIGPCTACDGELASFRRDGPSAGRQFAIVGLTSGRRPLS